MLANVRDFSIIVLALEALVVGGLLIWLVLEVRSLTRVLRDEIRPILSSTRETVNTVRGTTTFVSENVVAPFIKVQGYVAGVRAVVESLLGRDKDY